MTAHLLDVNVLIALIDPTHVHHEKAHAWFTMSGKQDWLSSPTTESGVVRIVSHPRYSNAARTPSVVIESLRSLRSVGQHRFAPDSISVLDPEHIVGDALLSSGQVTDSYLIALAANERAALATFDRRIVSTAVRDPRAKVVQIP